MGSVYEIDKATDNSVTKTVTYYPQAGAMRVNDTLYYTISDHLGSASAVTDASGTRVGKQLYFPYGESRLTTGSMFTDKLYDLLSKSGQREMTGWAFMIIGRGCMTLLWGDSFSRIRSCRGWGIRRV